MMAFNKYVLYIIYIYISFFHSRCFSNEDKGRSMHEIPSGPQVSTPSYRIRSTTSSKLLSILKDELQKRSPINEDETLSIELLEKEIGWDSFTNSFVNSEVLKQFDSAINGGLLLETFPRLSLIDTLNKPLYDIVDIVIPVLNNLDFLNSWKQFIEKFHIIIIQYNDPNINLKIPGWLNYELYNINDINDLLGSRSWVISKNDSSIKSFGYLVSDKKYIYSLDEDCLPAKDNEGLIVNSIESHIYNLLTPSTPYYFNTVYDPYRPSSDFVRGYPFLLRDGIETAVSHGLWMDSYDYDAPTQLLKSTDRNTKYIDATISVPYGVLYSMSSANLAFNRDLIGPAFMQGLMGDGQPLANYEDIFSGWASKKIGDHIGIGTKSGAPYIRQNKTNNPFRNLKKEYKFLLLQDEVINFFNSVQLSPQSKDAASAYKELAQLVKNNLSRLSPYFTRLGDAMSTWVDLWLERNVKGCLEGPCPPTLTMKASRSSMGPKYSNSTCAIFTVTHNENVILPIWIRYYSRHANLEDIWILDHETSDGSTLKEKVPEGINYKKLYGEAHFMPHHFLNRQVELHQQRLLRAGYPCVLFTEVDEIIAPDPLIFKGGLKEYLYEFALNNNMRYIRPEGYEIIHKNISSINTTREENMDWSQPIMQQRHFWVKTNMWNKPLLTKNNLLYVPGFHNNKGPTIEIDTNLRLIHLHSADSNYCHQREYKKYLGS